MLGATFYLANGCWRIEDLAALAWVFLEIKFRAFDCIAKVFMTVLAPCARLFFEPWERGGSAHRLRIPRSLSLRIRTVRSLLTFVSCTQAMFPQLRPSRKSTSLKPMISRKPKTDTTLSRSSMSSWLVVGGLSPMTSSSEDDSVSSVL